MLLNRGDSLLVEAPTYSGSLAFLRPFGANLVGVETDGGGLIPEDLDRVLDSWDESSQGKKPKVLYTIPNGSNPTGGSLNERRRRHIYATGNPFSPLPYINMTSLVKYLQLSVMI